MKRPDVLPAIPSTKSRLEYPLFSKGLEKDFLAWDFHWLARMESAAKALPPGKQCLVLRAGWQAQSIVCGIYMGFNPGPHTHAPFIEAVVCRRER